MPEGLSGNDLEGPRGRHVTNASRRTRLARTRCSQACTSSGVRHSDLICLRSGGTQRKWPIASRSNARTTISSATSRWAPLRRSPQARLTDRLHIRHQTSSNSILRISKRNSNKSEWEHPPEVQACEQRALVVLVSQLALVTCRPRGLPRSIPAWLVAMTRAPADSARRVSTRRSQCRPRGLSRSIPLWLVAMLRPRTDGERRASTGLSGSCARPRGRGPARRGPARRDRDLGRSHRLCARQGEDERGATVGDRAVGEVAAHRAREGLREGEAETQAGGTVAGHAAREGTE